tara:strand:+ start:5545 stop:5805 length:261 start_codon:yes stop_codon:yes gene_type:complete
MIQDFDLEFYRGKTCVVYYESTDKGKVKYIQAFEDYEEAQTFRKILEKQKDKFCVSFINMDYFQDEGIRAFLDVHKNAVTPTKRLH